MAGAGEVIERSVTLPVGAEEAFAWHERPGALERLVPPWERVEVLERSGGITAGARVVVRVHQGPVTLRWVARHRDYQRGRPVRRRAGGGPLRPVGAHPLVRAAGPGIVPASPTGSSSPCPAPRPGASPGRSSGGGSSGCWPIATRCSPGPRSARAISPTAPRPRIAVTGAGGLLGADAGPVPHDRRPPRRRHRPAAARAGRDRLGLRRPAGSSAQQSRRARRRRPPRRRDDRRPVDRRAQAPDPGEPGRRHPVPGGDAGPPAPAAAGAGLGVRRRDLRRPGRRDPDRGELPRSTRRPTSWSRWRREWEAAAEPARAAGIRVVLPRFGMVLSPAGGALGRMLPPFRLGVGGPLGSGRQWMSWIAIDDVVGAMHHALMTDGAGGPGQRLRPGPGDQSRVRRDPRAGARPAGGAPGPRAGAPARSSARWRTSRSSRAAAGAARAAAGVGVSRSATPRWSRRCAFCSAAEPALPAFRRPGVAFAHDAPQAPSCS